MKSHGEATGNCILSDRVPDTFVCEISSWCPVEIDRLPLDREDGPLIPGAESYTVFIKNSISFTRFGEDYHRNNMPRGICIYEHDDEGKKKGWNSSLLDIHIFISFTKCSNKSSRSVVVKELCTSVIVQRCIAHTNKEVFLREVSYIWHDAMQNWSCIHVCHG